jgi:hypothetical protein
MTIQEAQATIIRLNNQISALEQKVKILEDHANYWMGESSNWRDLVDDLWKRLETKQGVNNAPTPKKPIMREGNVIFMNNLQTVH